MSPARDGGGEPLLAVTDLRTTLASRHGPVPAVDGISLRLDRGRTLGVVGESGSGKTMLARSIMGLLPHDGVQVTGSVRFDGEELVGRSEDELRRVWGTRMAMVFQDPMTSLNPVMKVGHQITEPLRYHLRLPRREAEAVALELLRSIGIPEPARRLGQNPHELSGGMRQRVVIAVALAAGPQLLFADEPTTALDVTVQSQILDLLARERRERDMALVLVTHDLGVVAGRTDEIAVVYAGQVVEQAPTRTLFANVRMPYTQALLRSIPALDGPTHRRLPAIAGRPPSPVARPAGCRFSPRCPLARARCHQEAPPLVRTDDPAHAFRCWYPVGEGQAPGGDVAPVATALPDPGRVAS
ncbi:MAG: ABC transporter ATP-binding protein [Acidimicrobiia bacterium]